MTTFTVIPARANHCGQMCRMLRLEHRLAIARVNMDMHRELRRCFDASAFRRAWLIDGTLAGLGGIMGNVLSPYGFVWLALTEQARRYPIAVIKEARRQLDEIMSLKHELATTIIAGDESAKRLAIFLGFHIAHEGRGQRAYSRFGRRDLATYVESSAESRIPIGTGYAIALGYHHEAA